MHRIQSVTVCLKTVGGRRELHRENCVRVASRLTAPLPLLTAEKLRCSFFELLLRKKNIVIPSLAVATLRQRHYVVLMQRFRSISVTITRSCFPEIFE